NARDPELAAVVGAPALGAAIDHGTGVKAARGERLHARAEVGDRLRRAEAGRRRVVAELATGVVAPALGASIDHGAGMQLAPRERLHAGREVLHLDRGSRARQRSG